jgi:DNA invertase Pin-like site-specific DNA recombinase
VATELEQQIIMLRSNGHGYKAISQTTGVPRSTVRRILKGAESMPKIEPLTVVPSIAEDAVL